MTSASKNLQHLQCWAGGLDIEVVEPFIVGSHLGVRDPLENYPLRFSDLYDMNIWTTASNHTLASWDSFIQKAPRNLIRVEIRWDETADKVHGLTKLQFSPEAEEHVTTWGGRNKIGNLGLWIRSKNSM